MCTHLSDRILWNLCWVHAFQSNKVPIYIAMKHSIMRPFTRCIAKEGFACAKKHTQGEKFKQKERRIWCIFLMIPNKLIGIPWFNLHCFCFEKIKAKSNDDAYKQKYRTVLTKIFAIINDENGIWNVGSTQATKMLSKICSLSRYSEHNVPWTLLMFQSHFIFGQTFIKCFTNS